MDEYFNYDKAYLMLKKQKELHNKLKNRGYKKQLGFILDFVMEHLEKYTKDNIFVSSFEFSFEERKVQTRTKAKLSYVLLDINIFGFNGEQLYSSKIEKGCKEQYAFIYDDICKILNYINDPNNNISHIFKASYDTEFLDSSGKGYLVIELKL